MDQEKSGKRLAVIFVGIVAAAAITVFTIVIVFYNYYDPSKYGRSNGGVDANNIGIPHEAEEQRDKVGTPGTGQ